MDTPNREPFLCNKDKRKRAHAQATGFNCSNCLEGRKCKYWKDVLKQLDREEVKKHRSTSYYDPRLIDRRLELAEEGWYKFLDRKSKNED